VGEWSDARQRMSGNGAPLRKTWRTRRDGVFLLSRRPPRPPPTPTPSRFSRRDFFPRRVSPRTRTRYSYSVLRAVLGTRCPTSRRLTKRCRTTWTTRASAWARAPGSAMCSAASSGDSACASRSSLSTLCLWTSLQPTGALGRGAWVTRSAAAFESQQEVFGARALCHRRRLPGRWFRLRPVLHRDGTESGACSRQARALTVTAPGALTGVYGSTLVASFLT